MANGTEEKKSAGTRSLEVQLNSADKKIERMKKRHETELAEATKEREEIKQALVSVKKAELEALEGNG